MKVNQSKFYKHKSLPDKESTFVPVVDSAPPRSIDPALAVVFAPDPVTGLPNSDIAQFVNPNTSPEVAAYIKHRLMTENPSSPRTSNADDAFKSIPHIGENLSEYGTRMADTLKSNVGAAQE